MKTTLNRTKKFIHAEKSGDRVWVKAGIDFPTYTLMVEKKAYELFESRGRQDGCDAQDWFDAEKLVEADLMSNI